MPNLFQPVTLLKLPLEPISSHLQVLKQYLNVVSFVRLNWIRVGLFGLGGFLLRNFLMYLHQAFLIEFYFQL